jgi:transmembrane sensor
MERLSETEDERASDEATEWLILLQERPHDRALRGRFDAWRSASSRNDAAWMETCRFSQAAAALEPSDAGEWVPFVAARRQRAAGETRPARGASRRRAWLMPALSLAAAACLLVVFGPAILLRMQADYITHTAEQRQIELPDGSRLTLAPASAVALTFDGGERRVRLLSGEAFFEVRPIPRQPFRVTAREVDATVLGTRFNVRLDPDDVTVSVEEGVVEVARSAGLAERLGAGQSARVASTGAVSRTEEPAQLVAAWRQGQLYAHGLRLRDAVGQLRRYYFGTILLADDRLTDLRVTGAYNLDDPEEALRGMAGAHGASVRRVTPWLLILSGS